MHIANTKPLPSSEATPGMLRPISKLPQAFKSIKHTSNKHTARATQYRAASWLRLFDIVWKASGVRKVTRPAEQSEETMALVTILTAIWCQSRPATAAGRWAHREAGQEICFSWLDRDSSLHRAWVQRKCLVDSTVGSHTTAAFSSNPGRDDTMMALSKSAEYSFRRLRTLMNNPGAKKYFRLTYWGTGRKRVVIERTQDIFSHSCTGQSAYTDAFNHQQAEHNCSYN